MRIGHRLLNARMSQNLLQCDYIAPIHHEMACECMPQDVGCLIGGISGFTLRKIPQNFS